MPLNQENLNNNPTSTVTENVGLTSIAAAQRLKIDGYNELPSQNKRGFLRILFEIIRQPMFALLIGGGIVYLLLGDRVEALFLLVFACLSVAITIVQESRSERVLEALRNLASPRALVIRDGNRASIAGREVVIGDLMVIAEGDRVAADATLISAHDLLLDESLLTGESVAVRKLAPLVLTEKAVSTEKPVTTDESVITPGGEDSPYIFAGSLVVRGAGLAIAHATGIRSEMGKIGHALNTIDSQQPHLQKQLGGLVRNFTIIGAIAGLVAVVLYGLLRGSWLEAMLSGIALGMSLLPEEFPLVMAVFMAMGAWRISKVRVLTRRASAIESLGAVTVLCTDKTGTLTENKMTVVAVQAENETWAQANDLVITPSIQVVLKTALFACAQQPSDPMDIAIHKLSETQTVTNASSFDNYKLIRAYGLRPDCFAVANILTDANSDTNAYAKGARNHCSTLPFNEQSISYDSKPS